MDGKVAYFNRTRDNEFSFHGFLNSEDFKRDTSLIHRVASGELVRITVLQGILDSARAALDSVPKQ